MKTQLSSLFRNPENVENAHILLVISCFFPSLCCVLLLLRYLKMNEAKIVIYIFFWLDLEIGTVLTVIVENASMEGKKWHNKRMLKHILKVQMKIGNRERMKQKGFQRKIINQSYIQKQISNKILCEPFLYFFWFFIIRVMFCFVCIS